MKNITCLIILFSLFLTAQEAPAAPEKTEKTGTEDQPKHEEKKKADEPDEKKETPLYPVVDIKNRSSEYTLTTDMKKVTFRANLQIGQGCVIYLPENMQVTDSLIGDSSLLKAQSVDNKIKISGLIFPRATEADMYGLKSNYILDTNAGIKIEFVFTIRPDNPVTTVTLKYPAWENNVSEVQTMLQRYKNQINEEYEKKMKQLDETVKKRSVSMLSRYFGEFFSCNTYRVREEADLVFIGSDRICRIGTGNDKIILLNFQIKNRYRNYFYVKNVKVKSYLNSTPVDVGDIHLWVDKHGIQFDEELRGGIAFRVDDFASRYQIVVEEEGGKQRTLKLTVGW